ncbi:cell wall-binding repeat-containing protein [Desulfitobacterium metallireducens]|uniref:Cell wall-binding protein n=1 Tax=Desulfitobacterium metallireducens DSM 15288 TaxID=871968 RepID=W0EB43_9FIRM|nr:cell wall-binding repeat-containing protein [Desulfitobacterium metallireducens]AHF07987.1 cell wall-binding protein [Desulfitobacterium metallireducens DSM 15288]
MKNKNRPRDKYLAFLIIAMMLVIGIYPRVADAAMTTTTTLDYLVFGSDADNNLITGVTSTINFTLYGTITTTDPSATPQSVSTPNTLLKSGSYTAYITDPDGKVTYYPTSGSSISNVTLDKAGTYYLYVSDSSNNTASGTITVTDAKTAITGKLSQNYSSTVSVKLMDGAGNILPRKTVNVDATAIGGNVSSYTTLYDGTFSFTMTPTKMGTVNITVGGHIIGSINVTPAYTEMDRIGANASDNATRSVLVAQAGWTSSKYAVLTRDDGVADAMVAVPLAKKYDAPIFMTSTNQLNSSVLTELKQLGVETVLIIGGEGAVSSSVQNQLISNGIHTSRIAGTDRYETAAQIAYWVGSSRTVYLAYGYGEPDALAASALAAEQGIPILLTDSGALPESTAKALASLAPQNVKLLGGTGVISADLEQSLNQSYMVERWGGVDRYATQQAIFQNYFADQKAANSFPVYFTSSSVLSSDVGGGTPYGDALFTAALAAKNQGFVIALPPDNVPSSISTFLLYNKVYIPSSTVVGNGSAISYSVEAKLNQLLAR